MSKDKIISILEGALDYLKRAILFLPCLIGLIDPSKAKPKKKSTKK